MNTAITTRARSLVVLLTLGLLASVATAAETPLTNGVPVTEISGTAGSEKFYRIDVPAGQDELEIVTTGGTGDVDLYVRLGALPTVTSYDYRPYQVGNEETVTVPTPAAGTWYIMLRGYSAYASVTLRATYTGSAAVTPLTNGVPVPGLAGAASSERFFSIVVPAGQTRLDIAISGGSGSSDADLYVKRGAMPTVTTYDYRPYLFGSNESVTVNSPVGDIWYIMIRGYSAYADVTLLASYTGGVGTELENGVAVPDISGAAASEKIYRIEVPAGQINLEIMMSGGTGDADLYVKFGTKPTATDYDYRPYLAGNDETVTVNSPAAGTWYIMVRGFADYTGLSLKATYNDVFTLQDGVAVPALAGTLGSEKFYKIEVPSGQSDLVFTLSGGTGNADMYIRRGAKPTTSTWDYRPYLPGNDESVTINSPQAGTWYVMLKGRDAYSGVALKADYSFTGTVVLLTNGVPVTGIAGAASSEKFYRLVVPSGQTKLEFQISSGAAGDADLYVKKGSLPTVSDYDYRPYLAGSNETVTVNDPTGGDWFVMIRGYQAYSALTLLATFGGTTPPPVDDVTVLSNGVAVSSIAGAAGSEKFYKIDVPAGQAKLEIMTSGGTGDVDLYVRKGAKPTITDYDYRPYIAGNAETVTIDNPDGATWYIMLRGYQTYTDVTLKATYTPVAETITVLTNAVPVGGLSGVAGSEKFFKIDVPAGQDTLTFEISGGTGDADLYVRKGSKPTPTSYDYRPYLVGNNEKVEIATPAAATWYVMVRGYQAYSGLTLVATYTVASKGNNFTTDPDCVALWRFEPDKLTVDSIGTNTLTNNNAATVELTAFKEGVGAASFKRDLQQSLSITDLNLASGFPLKSGESNKKISICMWFRLAQLNQQYLWAKSGAGTSLAIYIQQNLGEYHVVLVKGTGDGTTRESAVLTSVVLSASRWYHLGVTYNDADRSYRIRLYDANTDTAVEAVANFANNIAITKSDLAIGTMLGSTVYYVDGLIDECVVFKDILTAPEIDKIRQGTYGKP